MTVARMGRSDCAQLDALLQGWNGQFSVQLRKRVAGHIDDCEVCGETRRRFAVIPMMSLAPALAAPAYLRDRTLAAAGQQLPSITYRFDSLDGFPAAPGRTGARLKMAGVAALLVVVLAGVLTVRSAGSQRRLESSPPASTLLANAPTTIVATTVGSTSAVTPTTVGTTPVTTQWPSTSLAPSTVAQTAPPTVAQTVPPTAASTPGQLTVSGAVVDLGATGEDASVTLSNVGDMNVIWSLAGDPGPFVWTVTSGSLAGGGSVDLHVGIDRSAVGEGMVSAAFVINASSGPTNNLQAVALVERSPQITLLSAPTAYTCPWSVAPMVNVKATDESTIQSMVLKWTSRRTTGNTAMNPSGPDQWRGSLGMAQSPATWVWTVTAADSRGNSAMITGEVIVDGC